MLILENLRKTFPTSHGRKVVFNSINAVFPTGQSVAILGRNGAGKSTLLDVISGVQAPDDGRVLTSGNISYPVGFSGAFAPTMTGKQAARFVGRLYGADTDGMVRFVQDFTELGNTLDQQLYTYSSGQRARLSFAISMAIPFDIYLIDEVSAVGDANFRFKARALFEERMKNSDIIMVSHSMRQVRDFCTMGAVLNHGELQIFADIDAAISEYNRINADANRADGLEQQSSA